MKPMMMIAAGLFAGSMFATTANAAPLGGVVSPVAPEESLVVQIHNGFHSSCQLGPRGWHYDTPRTGRIECRPRRPIGFGWSWRESDGRRGWYQERNRRWH